METEEIKIQINVPEGKKLVGTKVENGVIIPIFKDKEGELSNTWEEWCKKNKRDEFRQGWEPNYGDDSYNYSITYYDTAIKCEMFVHYSAILSFQSAGIRDKFLKNFRELIEQAKELL